MPKIPQRVNNSLFFERIFAGVIAGSTAYFIAKILLTKFLKKQVIKEQEQRQKWLMRRFENIREMPIDKAD